MKEATWGYFPGDQAKFAVEKLGEGDKRTFDLHDCQLLFDGRRAHEVSSFKAAVLVCLLRRCLLERPP